MVAAAGTDKGGNRMNTAWQQELIEIAETAPIVRSLEITASYDDQGHAHLKLPYNPGFDNATGRIHGGIVASLLESAGWYAVAAQNEGIWTATSQFSIHLLNPGQKTELHAEGWVLKSGKRISVAEMKVFTPDGKLIATGSGTYVVLESIPLSRDPE
jgi:acyl-CoA thioesterase